MTAPFVIEGAMNGPMFLAYVRQCLVPTLKRGEMVLMDKPLIWFNSRRCLQQNETLSVKWVRDGISRQCCVSVGEPTILRTQRHDQDHALRRGRVSGDAQGHRHLADT
jgi:hypothetical protein